MKNNRICYSGYAAKIPKKMKQVLMIIIVFLWSCIPNEIIADVDTLKTPNDFFRDTKVWDISLTLSSNDYDLLEPKGGRGFGADFNYVQANVTISGKLFKNVGLRYKGNSSFSSARSIPKKSFKIDFNRFVKGQKFVGLTKLSLNNNVLDPSQIREAIAYRLWRKLKLPGSKTTFARITLTVPGRYNKKLLGLYVVVEQVNGPFLKERFGTDKGLLLKPERNISMPYLGESFTEYEKMYVPKSNAKPSLNKRLIAFTWLVSKADNKTFAEQISDFVDLDILAKFTAAHTVLSHLDSFLLRGHNYYLYLPKANSKFVFLPWDLNSTFASHRSAGSPDQQFNLSLRQPFAKDQRLLERLMKIKSFRKSYEIQLKKLISTHFAKEAITRDMTQFRDAVAPTVREDEYTDYREFLSNFQIQKDNAQPERRSKSRVIRKPLLREFITKRHESISAQWADEREGYTPRSRMRTGNKEISRPNRQEENRSRKRVPL